MRECPKRIVGVIVAAGILAVACSAARGETFKLELKRLEPLDLAQGAPPADYVYRMAQPQRCLTAVGARVRAGQPSSGPLAEFSQVVSKEPADYHCEHPFRGVASLGSQQYGFVLDTKDAESKEYSQLRFDVNHNGDLTDDPVLEGKQPGGPRPNGYWYCQFPRVDLKIEIDGTRADYSFFFSAYAAFMNFTGLEQKQEEESDDAKPDVRYIVATLQSACYREGEVRLNDKTKRVVLLDFNSNGRFDDKVQIREIRSGSVRPTFGDAMLVDPEPGLRNVGVSYYDLMESQVARFAQIDGGLYDLGITPGGDELTLSSASVPVGYVTIPSDGFRGTVYGEMALLKIEGDKSAKVALPAGKWKLMSYTIDRTGYEEQASEQEKSSLLESLTGALLGAASSQSRITQLRASGSEECQLLEVREGETLALPFGPPFKPVVAASGSVRGGETARIGLTLLGAGGERCTSVIVNGKKPDKPEFTITTADGEEVATGAFEYG